MPSITLSYGSGAATDRTFSKALSVKGFKPGDGHEVVPRLRPDYLDGSVRKKQAGFRRIFTIDLGILTDNADLAHIGAFLNSEFQYLTYTYDNDVTEAAKSLAAPSQLDGSVSPVQGTIASHGWSNNDLVRVSGVTLVTPSTINADWRIANKTTNTFDLSGATGYSGTEDVSGTVQRIKHSITETDLQVVDNHEEWESLWTAGVETGRRIVLTLTEADMRTSYPT